MKKSLPEVLVETIAQNGWCVRMRGSRLCAHPSPHLQLYLNAFALPRGSGLQLSPSNLLLLSSPRRDGWAVRTGVEDRQRACTGIIMDEHPRLGKVEKNNNKKSYLHTYIHKATPRYIPLRPRCDLAGKGTRTTQDGRGKRTK